MGFVPGSDSRVKGGLEDESGGEHGTNEDGVSLKEDVVNGRKRLKKQKVSTRTLINLNDTKRPWR